MSNDKNTEARTALPDGSPYWAVITEYFLRGNEEIVARWHGGEVSVYVGGLNLRLSVEQWRAIRETVDSVVPQGVTA